MRGRTGTDTDFTRSILQCVGRGPDEAVRRGGGEAQAGLAAGSGADASVGLPALEPRLLCVLTLWFLLLGLLEARFLIGETKLVLIARAWRADRQVPVAQDTPAAVSVCVGSRPFPSGRSAALTLARQCFRGVVRSLELPLALHHFP